VLVLIGTFSLHVLAAGASQFYQKFDCAGRKEISAIQFAASIFAFQIEPNNDQSLPTADDRCIYIKCKNFWQASISKNISNPCFSFFSVSRFFYQPKLEKN
jgi:hypothetical protein